MTLRLPLVGAAWLAGLLLGGPAVAQSDAGGQAIITKLKPVAQAGTASRSLGQGAGIPRSDNLLPAPVWPGGAAVAPRAVAWSVPRPTVEALRPRGSAAQAAIALPLTFAPGSASLSADSERLLSPVGEALASPDLTGYRFRIEGHTDSVGDADANMALSEQRAVAVRNYLVRAWGVDPRRLVVVGFGSSQPLVATPPQVPEPRNRRIQVVTLGN